MKRVKLDKWVREQEGLSSLTRGDIEKVQLRKLNRLLKREKERGGFYGNLPEKLDRLEQLAQLPFTGPQDLIRHGNRMVLLSQSEIDRVRTEETSGTTGYAKRVFYSEKDNERTVSFFAAGLSELVNPGERTLICMPFSGYRGLGEMIAEAIARLGAEPVPAGVGRTYGELLELTERYRPQTFVGMPVPLLSLLRMNPESTLERALVSADACPDSVMRGIEAILRTRLYPHYGSREMGLGGAVTCPAFEGMHLRENDIIAEIVGLDGQPLPKGEWGELVITTVQADAMPLIRYRTGDYTRILPEPCPCGSSLCRLDRIRRMEGRNPMEELDDLLFADGNVIDYRALRQGEGLLIEGYLLAEPLGGSELRGRQEQRGLFPDIWKSYPVTYRWKRVRGEDSPCYPAKRVIVPGQRP